MSFTRFAAVVAGTLVVTLGVSLPALDADQRTGVLCGAVVAALNALAAYGLVLYSRQRSNVVFMRAILGGMTVRMGVMLLAVVAAVRLYDVPQVPLILSLLVHFTLFLAFELLTAHRTAAPRLEEAR